MKRYLIGQMCLLAVVGSMVAIALAVGPPKPAPRPSAEEAAWTDALKRAGATEEERSGVPTTVRYPFIRFDEVPDGCPNLKEGQVCLTRLCGLTRAFRTMIDGQRTWTTITETYLDPKEDAGYGHDGLVHEYLHVIWFRRTLTDPFFYVANPDSEAWVRRLVPTQCPTPKGD